MVERAARLRPHLRCPEDAPHLQELVRPLAIPDEENARVKPEPIPLLAIQLQKEKKTGKFYSLYLMLHWPLSGNTCQDLLIKGIIIVFPSKRC